MAVFEYSGLVALSGKQVRGFRDADNAKLLRAVLKREGVLLVHAAEDTRGKAGATRNIDLFAFLQRVTVGDVAMMTRQLATLVVAGIPLVEAVAALTDQVEKAELKRVLTQVRDRLNEGTSLAKALEPHPQIFPPLYVNMVGAGEASGTLETVLERLSDFMEDQAKLRSKVSAALAYPVLMLLIGTGLITLMMIAVVPKVTAIFQSLDHALPWYTSVLIFVADVVSSNQTLGFVLTVLSVALVRRAIAVGSAAKAAQRAGQIPKSDTGAVVVAAMPTLAIGIGAFLVESWFALLVGCALGGAAGFFVARFQGFLATPAGRLWRDTVFLRLPLFGTLVRMVAVARFSRTLSTLLRSGVPLLRAMDIVKNVLGNAKLQKVIESAIGSIREGESIAQPLKRSGDFPPIVTHMIAVGEKSGQLEQMLENVARAYDTQVETRIQAMTSLLEPLIIVVMGAAVGFIAFSILMPLIQMNDFVQ